MYIFAFNLYTQINLFIKHIFTNKFITIPYYIYTDRWSAPRCLVVAGVLVVSVAYMQTTPRRARHEAPQRGGRSCF